LSGPAVLTLAKGTTSGDAIEADELATTNDVPLIAVSTAAAVAFGSKFSIVSTAKTHCLLADEIQNFTHDVNLSAILSEARKYALSWTVATQTLSQLPEKMVASIFGNAATIVSFRVSHDDAMAPVREFAANGEGPRLSD
jgi:type IV secretory system conjugative DNA transfer VirD4/TraG family protein